MSTNNKIQVRKADILAMREKGMTQSEIASHYSVSQSEVKKLFDFLGIKGRPKQKPIFEIIEDGSEIINTQEVQTPVVEQSQTTESVQQVVEASNTQSPLTSEILMQFVNELNNNQPVVEEVLYPSTATTPTVDNSF